MLRLHSAVATVLAGALLFLAPILPVSASTRLGVAAPATCTQLLANGGFEQQTANRVLEPASGVDLISDFNPRTGSYSAYLGGIPNSDHSIRQQITLPEKQIIIVTFWVYQETLEHAPNLDDYLSVRLLRPNNSQLAEVARYGVDPELPLAFQQFRLSLSAYAGQTVQLQFLVHNDVFDETTYFIDDISVSACTAQYVYLPLIRR